MFPFQWYSQDECSASDQRAASPERSRSVQAPRRRVFEKYTCLYLMHLSGDNVEFHLEVVWGEFEFVSIVCM